MVRKFFFVLLTILLISAFVQAQEPSCQLDKWNVKYTPYETYPTISLPEHTLRESTQDFSVNVDSTEIPYFVEYSSTKSHSSEEDIIYSTRIKTLGMWDSLETVERSFSPHVIELRGEESEGKQIAKLFVTFNPNDDHLELKTQFRSDTKGIKRVKIERIPISEIVVANNLYFSGNYGLTVGIRRIDNDIEFFYSLDGLSLVNGQVIGPELKVIKRIRNVPQIELQEAYSFGSWPEEGETKSSIQQLYVPSFYSNFVYNSTLDCTEGPNNQVNSLPKNYKVCTVEDWDKMRNSRTVPTEMHVELICDLDFGNKNIKPLRNLHEELEIDSFNGNGHTISNFKIIASEEDNIGLFAEAPWAIKNVRIENVEIEGRDNVGLFAGKGHISLSDIFAENIKVTGNDYVGGIVGGKEPLYLIYDAILRNVQVSGNDYVGGLSGASNSYKTQIVKTVIEELSLKGNDYVGGFVGKAQSGGTLVYYSSVQGDIIGNDFVGGAIGEAEAVRVFTSFTDTNLQGNTNVGGFAGSIYKGSRLYHSYAAGAITASGTKGGLIATEKSISGASSSQTQELYYDKDKAGSSSVHGTGLTSQEMLDFESYREFNPALWYSKDGAKPYPIWYHYRKFPNGGGPLVYYPFTDDVHLILEHNLEQAITQMGSYNDGESLEFTNTNGRSLLIEDGIYQNPSDFAAPGVGPFSYQSAVGRVDGVSAFFGNPDGAPSQSTFNTVEFSHYDFDKDWTISFYVKPRSDSTARQNLVGKFNVGSPASPAYIFLENGKISASVTGFTGQTNSAGQQIRDTVRATTQSIIPEDEWTHITVTYDKTYITIFVNGEMDRRVGASLEPYTNEAPITIGAKHYDPSTKHYTEAYHGQINYFRLYDRALQPWEVETIDIF